MLTYILIYIIIGLIVANIREWTGRHYRMFRYAVLDTILWPFVALGYIVKYIEKRTRL